MGAITPARKLRKPKTTSTSLDKFSQPLTMDSLRALVIKCTQTSLKPPDNKALVGLFITAEKVKAAALIDRDLNLPAHENNIKSHAAVRHLLEILRKKNEALSRDIAFLKPGVATYFDMPTATEDGFRGLKSHIYEKEASLELGGRLINDLTALSCNKNFMFPIDPAPTFRDQWPHYLQEIVVAYRLAMSAANPEARLKIHAVGPNARFIAALIPHLTGETTTAAGVASRWRDMAQSE